MKILHVVENLNRGGLERTVIDLATLQLRKNNVVHVLCIMNKGALARELEDAGIQVISIDKDASGVLIALKRIRSFLCQINPDIIHTHNPMANYFIALGSMGMGRVNIVNTRHGMGQYWRNIKGKMLYIFSLIRTQYVVAVCDTAKNLLVSTNQVIFSKVITIKNGIDKDKFFEHDILAKQRLCDMLNIPLSSKLIGTVGRLNYVKNHKFLIQVFNELCMCNQKVHLIVIGDGELRRELKQQVVELELCECVHFLGDRNDVNLLLSALDIFILTSISEGFSIALLEACAARLPIIATDVGGNREIVQHGKTGLLISSNDTEELLSSMMDLISNEKLSRELSEHAYHWLVKEASLGVMCEKYMMIYEKAINRDSRI